MKFDAIVWLLMGAYAVHILEEFAFNWRDWARSVLKLPVDWPTFYVTNSIVIALGIVAMRQPARVEARPPVHDEGKGA